MSLLQEAADRRKDREPELTFIEKLRNDALNIIEKHGQPGSKFNPYELAEGMILNIPLNESEEVGVEMFSTYGRGTVVILIKEISKSIYLKGLDTIIRDASETPEKTYHIDQISLKELEQWEKVFKSIKKAISA